MNREWAENRVTRQARNPLQTLLYHLLIDVIPVLLLLAVMAYGMAFVAHKLSEPRSVEIQAVSEKLS